MLCKVLGKHLFKRRGVVRKEWESFVQCDLVTPSPKSWLVLLSVQYFPHFSIDRCLRAKGVNTCPWGGLAKPDVWFLVFSGLNQLNYSQLEI